MLLFIGRRLLQLAVLLVAVSTVLFLMLRLTGDPVAVMLGDNASPETVAAMRHSLGLDQPLYVQYLSFLAGALTLRFGNSVVAQQDAMQLVLTHLLASLQLVVVAFVLAVACGIPMGVYAAVKRGSFGAGAVLVVAFFGQAVPGFWLAILALLIFSVHFHWFPSYGAGDIRHLVLPALTLAITLLAKLVRVTRSGMLDVLMQDYLRTGHAKGLSPRLVVWRHAVKNAIIPVVTVLGFDLSLLIGGAVIVETIFAWPGIGRLLVDSVTGRDYPVVQATTFVVACLVVLINLIVDGAYRLLDPRIGLS